MDIITVNLKEDTFGVDQALAIAEIEISLAKKGNAKAIKFVHGYGSHGVGGAICNELRKLLFNLKKQKSIKDFFIGFEWTIENEKVLNYLVKYKNHYEDEDLGSSNPGITIVIV